MIIEVFYCCNENRFIRMKHCDLCFWCCVDMPDQCISSNWQHKVSWLPFNGTVDNSMKIKYSFDGEHWIDWLI